METDEELVKRTLSGETDCYGVLVQRHADYLFGLGMRFTAGNREFAEDVSQQSFLRAYKYLKSFNPKKKFKQWLTGIAVNCYKDLSNKESQYLSLEAIDEPSYTPDLGGNTGFFELIKPLASHSVNNSASPTAAYTWAPRVPEHDQLGLKVQSRPPGELSKPCMRGL